MEHGVPRLNQQTMVKLGVLVDGVMDVYNDHATRDKFLRARRVRTPMDGQHCALRILSRQIGCKWNL